MTVNLAAIPVCADQLDLLDLVADNVTPLGSLHRDDFRAACMVDAAHHQGWVNPNRVHAILLDRFGEVGPQWFSSQWAPACGPKGFLDKTDVKEPIDPTHSKGNGGKEVLLRRLREVSA